MMTRREVCQPVAERVMRYVVRLALLALLIASATQSLFAQPLDDPPLTPNGANELPWARNQNQRNVLPATRIASARQMLINVDNSELSRFIDRQPLATDDEETLYKILYRWPAFGQDDVERLQKTDVTWQELVDDPKAHRVEIFRLVGRVKQVDKQQLLPETASRLEYDHYYQVTFALEHAPNPVLICAREVPKAWKIGEPIDERASCFGLFIKVGDSSGPDPELVFAVQRVAWHPDHVDAELGVTADHVLLGDLGMDVGRFDEIRNRTHGIAAHDRECFYQLLATTGRANRQDWQSHTQRQIDLAAVLNDPQKQQGSLMMVRGVARRITKIEVPDRDIQERFGIDHYYQLDVFVALPPDMKGIRLVDAKGDSAGVEFTNNFPVNICVLQLPESLAKHSNRSEGEFLSERIVLPAVFFKLWAYKTEYVSRIDSEQFQFGPLLVGLEPDLDPIDTRMNPTIALAGGILFLVALAAIWIGLWRYNRSDTKFERDVLKRKFDVEPGKSLDQMGIESQDGPDFSKLD